MLMIGEFEEYIKYIDSNSKKQNWLHKNIKILTTHE